jgi:CheY-like chemotaxis protein
MILPESRVLCVDDDTHTYDWIRIVLRNSKVNAIISRVSDGQKAIEQLALKPFDLCIVDYALPDMTGVQLCLRLRQMACHVPVMFFTPMNRPIDRELAFAAGAAAYLCKPDDLAMFATSVIRILPQRQSTRASRLQWAA